MDSCVSPRPRAPRLSWEWAAVGDSISFALKFPLRQEEQLCCARLECSCKVTAESKQ